MRGKIGEVGDFCLLRQIRENSPIDLPLGFAQRRPEVHPIIHFIEENNPVDKHSTWKSPFFNYLIRKGNFLTESSQISSYTVVFDELCLH